MRYYLTNLGMSTCQNNESDDEVRRFYNSHLVTLDSEMKFYFEVKKEPLDPLVDSPVLDGSHIEKVTYIGTIISGFNDQGIYRNGNSVGKLETKSRHFGAYSLFHQEIHIRSNSEEDLFEIYAMIRGKDLEPETNWGNDEVSCLFAGEGNISEDMTS